MVTTLLRRLARTARRPFRPTRRNDPPKLEALETRMLLSTALQPTAQEQLLLVQLNAIRADPAGYGRSIGLDLSNVAPSQPLAFNTELEAAARAHSQDMNNQDYFGHNTPQGEDPGQRMSAAGFSWGGWGESIAAGFPSSADALQGLIVDKGVPDLGHRLMLLAQNSLFQSLNQVGVGIVNGSGPYGSYYTIDAANAANDNNSFLTGVVFNDANGNGRYDVGEGLGGVTVTANNGASTTTFGSGGYSLELGPGTYTVTFNGSGLAAPVVRTVTVGKQNVEVDVTNPPAGTPAPPAPVPAPPVVAPPPPAGLSLAPISDQWLVNSTGMLQVGLVASDAAGLPVTYQVSVQGADTAGAIGQQLGLHVDASGYHQNTLGQNEKWLVGNGNALWGWYEVLPDGTVRPWYGGNNFGASVGTFGSAVWANPSLLSGGGNASGVTGSVSGNTLTLSGLQGYTGKLEVTVTASDGVSNASRTFQVNVTNAPLTLAPIANLSAAQGSPVQVALASVDAGGNPVTYRAQVTGHNAAYDLQQQLNLAYTGNLRQDTLGLNEKWLQSPTGNQANGGWYVVLPDGEVRPWTGGNTTGATLATLGTDVYNNPALLYNAAAPGAVASFSGNALTLSPPGNFVGSLEVTVTASDGTNTTSRNFAVTVT